MAITLQVPLTDQEQAKIVKVAQESLPEATGPEIKAWAEKFMKDALREEVIRIAIETAREAANVARRNAEQSALEGWDG